MVTFNDWSVFSVDSLIFTFKMSSCGHFNERVCSARKFVTSGEVWYSFHDYHFAWHSFQDDPHQAWWNETFIASLVKIPHFSMNAGIGKSNGRFYLNSRYTHFLVKWVQMECSISFLQWQIFFWNETKVSHSTVQLVQITLFLFSCFWNRKNIYNRFILLSFSNTIFRSQDYRIYQ